LPYLPFALPAFCYAQGDPFFFFGSGSGRSSGDCFSPFCSGHARTPIAVASFGSLLAVLPHFPKSAEEKQSAS
jgi:hypothetical protein